MNRRGFLKFLPGAGAAIGALGAVVPAFGVLGGRVASKNVLLTPPQFAKDAQKMYSYTRSAYAEMISQR